jgi:hypothetical protein
MPSETFQRPLATRNDRQLGFDTAYRIFARMTAEERELRAKWIDARKLPEEVADAAEIVAARSSKLTSSIENDREAVDGLLEAGLLLTSAHRPAQRGLFPFDCRDFFQTPRVLFPLRNETGEIVGYAGRALPGDEPKYLYTRGFPRNAVLYRMHAVRKRLLAAARSRHSGSVGERAHLFIVEGIVDALRLESLGLDAVAVFGNSITETQVGILSRLAADVERMRQALVVHVFLDTDEAGRRGTVQSLRRILREASSKHFFLVDVIHPRSDDRESAHDPDEFFRNVENNDDTRARIIGSAYPVVSALLAAAWNLNLPNLADRWNDRSYAQEVLAFREMEQLFSNAEWTAIWERLRPTCVWFEERDHETAPPWGSAFRQFVTPSKREAEVLETQPSVLIEPSAEEQLQRAVQLAHSSTQRRELPVDEGSWERIELALDAFVPYFRDLLQGEEGPVEPFVAVKVPKPDGTFRLKALPAPEELTLQQYMLMELLREYPQSRRFSDLIPAVRYSRRGLLPLRTTGPEHLRPRETVSFAYQVDTEVVEGVLPPRREGIFRPYYQCWQQFIRFLDTRCSRIASPLLHVARLDIRRYYDTLSRTAVNDVLFRSLKQALTELVYADNNGTLACASVFAPRSVDPEERAQKIVDWLCKQSFGFRYLRPEDGATEDRSRSHGVPQGPDLSAYLANIALFPMDRAVDAHAAEHAVYARYVDDIVLVAVSAGELRELRTVVEAELAQLGLELNKKSQQYDPMTKEAFRSWLTDRKGGLDVSGVFAGPPLNQPLLMDDPLFDEEVPDRTDALRLLYDSEYLCAETPRVVKAVRAARRADEMRHNDLVRAALLLWRCAGSEAARDKAVYVPSKFVELWRDANPASSTSQSRAISQSSSKVEPNTLFAWLDGLGAMLLARPELIRELSTGCQKHVLRAQQELAQFVCNKGNVCRAIGEVEEGLTDAAEIYRHSVVLKCLQVLAVATRHDVNLRRYALHDIGLTDTDPNSAPIARLVMSIAESTGSNDLILGASQHTTRAILHPTRLWFHEAICRLRIDHGQRQRELETNEPRPDPLFVIAQRIRGRINDGNSAADQCLTSILACWSFPDGIDLPEMDVVTVDSALRSFVNVARDNTAELMTRRPVFGRRALGEEGEQIRLIPGLPGMETPGLLGLKGESLVRRRDLRRPVRIAGEEEFHWQECGTRNGLVEAELPSGRLLMPLEFKGRNDALYPPDSCVDQVAWLADAFSRLADIAAASSSCPPTPLNIVASTNDSLPIAMLGYEEAVTNQSQSRRSGFLCLGINSLARVEVPQFYAPLWQVGTALAELLGCRHHTESLDGVDDNDAHIASDSSVQVLARKVLRVALYRLRGKWDPTSFVAQDKNGWPKTVARALDRLKDFPRDDAASAPRQALAVFIGLFAEGKALHLRFGDESTSLDTSASGAATTFLADMAQQFFGSDAELADGLPIGEMPSPRLRKPVSTWLRIAERIDRLGDRRAESEEEDVSLAALAAGCRILALTSYFRSLTLELWSTRTADDVQRVISGDWPEVSSWMDEQWLLHRSQIGFLDAKEVGTFQPNRPVAKANGGDDEMAGNLRELLHLLDTSTSVTSARYWLALGGITPLGWLAALQFTLKAWGDVWKPRVDRDSDRAPTITLGDVQDAMYQWSQTLATPVVPIQDGQDDMPWGDLRHAIRECSSSFVHTAIQQLRDLESEIGIQVAAHASTCLHLGNSRAERIEVRVEDGTRDLRAWQISVATAARESSSQGVEFYYEGERRVFRWTESRLNGKLIGLHIARPAIARWAGDASDQDEDKWAESRASVPLPEEHSEPAQEKARSVNEEDVSPTTNSSEVSAGRHDTDHIRTTVKEGDALRALRRHQEDSWPKRRIKLPSHLRVAFVQWRVDDTYRHPIVDICAASHDNISDVLKHPGNWNATRAGKNNNCVKSCNEYRRRKILEEVLRACRHFKVDVLLLPEYSVRPETVGWLGIQLPELSPHTCIWAGTFRKPPYTRFMTPESDMLTEAPGLGRSPDWSSHLILVSPGGVAEKHFEPMRKPLTPAPSTRERGEARISDRHFVSRCKKYPAVGLGELFAPSIAQLQPLFTNRTGDDLRTKLTELICSEIFLVTSPSNLTAAAYAYRELLQRFVPGDRTTNLDLEELIQILLRDLVAFGADTSVVASPIKRRSIILVPAMTSRSVDYAVLGQAGFLASGLTTVFCNAVDPPFGGGNSCFVGHDGWGNDANGLPALPRGGPYHGVLPGIFRPAEPTERGCLGKEEQAMVIADIDTQFPMEGKPRPQLLPPPLQLVAHLPILETWKKPEIADIGDKRGRCRCQQYQPYSWRELRTDDWPRTARASGNSSRNDVAGILRELMRVDKHDWVGRLASALRQPGTLTTVDHQSRSTLAEALVLLAIAFRDSKWMWRRMEQFLCEHAANPQPWPPPVALDWLLVDLNLREDEVLPEIEVPPYANLGNDYR